MSDLMNFTVIQEVLELAKLKHVTEEEEYDADRLREAIHSINDGTSTPEDIDIYCDFLSKYDV